MSRRRTEKRAPDDRPDRDRLEKALGHRFADRKLLSRALTHPSATRDRARSNQRLEFLGDRVLGLIAARMLLEAFPDEEEGKLGYRFSALVRRETLARVAREIGLPPHFRLSAGEEDAGGRDQDGLVADGLEAVIAALFLDGGLSAAEAFVEARWRPLMAEDPVPPKDAKTTLQEWAQSRGLPVPDYAVTGEAGPPHAPVFTVELTLSRRDPVRADGPSKKAAEQAAAEAMLRRIAEPK